QLEKLAVLVERQGREVLHVAAQVVREVMQSSPGRATSGIAALEPEAVQRGHLEMILEREDSRLGRERPVVVPGHNLEAAAQQLHQLAGFPRTDDLGRAQTLEFGEQLRLAVRL